MYQLIPIRLRRSNDLLERDILYGVPRFGRRVGKSPSFRRYREKRDNSRVMNDLKSSSSERMK